LPVGIVAYIKGPTDNNLAVNSDGSINVNAALTSSLSGLTTTVNISGQVLQTIPFVDPTQPIVKTKPILHVGITSGGATFGSQPANFITVRSLPTNTSGQGVWVGAGAAAAGSAMCPFSGRGFFLAPGDSITLGCNNYSDVACFGYSGDYVCVIGN